MILVSDRSIALAALAFSALALTQSGGVLAQNPTNTYENPQPCGPGAGTAFMPEPHEITSGHFALFDAYWESRPQHPEDDANYLHTNLCPPNVVTTTEENEDGGEITVTTLVDSNIDIGEAIFHVLDTHKVDVVATNAEATAGQLSLAEYPAVRVALGLKGSGDIDPPVPAGTQVWWLQLDDPDTPDQDETSDLTLGFSTRHLDDQYWYDADNVEKPLAYRLEAGRYPSRTVDDPNFFAYLPPQDNNGLQEQFVWSSAAAGIGVMEMEPGVAFEDLQWIFTRPGTYEIWVELVAHVRTADDRPTDAPTNWQPISTNKTETSEVRRYVIHVGDELVEEEPPVFGFNLSVPENSAAGTEVSDPIAVFQAEEAEGLSYSLSGEGSEDFTLATTTEPNTVQILVADGALLDYETRKTYDLILSVTDGVDHESNPDPTVDDVLAVRIALEDIPTAAILTVDNPNPVVGESVTFTVTLTDFGHGQTVYSEFITPTGSSPGYTFHWSTTKYRAETLPVHFYAWYFIVPNDFDTVHSITSNTVHVSWSAASPRNN